MAEIPVERKEGGLPWWLIPLILLLILIPLLWFFGRACNSVPASNSNTNSNVNRAATTGANSVTGNGANSPEANVGNTNGSTIAVDNKGTATGERVTDVNIFGSTADKLSLVGRGVTLTKVKVNRVLSDHVFTVTSGQGEMFAFLDQSLLNAGGKEQQITMRPGQIVNLGGEFRKVPNAEVKNEAQNRDLDQKLYEQMKGQQVYLHATSVEDAK